MILSVLTLESSSTMDRPYFMEHGQASLGLKPTCEPEISTAFLRSFVILVIRIVDLFFLWYTTHSGVWPPALCYQRCATRRLIAATAQALG